MGCLKFEHDVTVAFPKDERDNSSGEFKMGVNETCQGNYLKENNKFPFFLEASAGSY